MEPCLCSTIRQLAIEYDNGKAGNLASALNRHLRDLRAILSQSKSLARDVQYQVTLNNQRTMKALLVDFVDQKPLKKICEMFKDDALGFWTPSNDVVHTGLHRRLACVVIFLRSKLDVEVPVPPQISRLLRPNQKYAELRNSGRKYIKISRKLGGLGALFWLPLDIPHSTYERYLNMDDEEVFGHLKSLKPEAECYADFAQKLILSQFHDLPSSCSYHNLFVNHSDVIPSSDLLPLFLHAFGGSRVPHILLDSIRSPQRRWNQYGEMENTSAYEFDIPTGLVDLLSNQTELSQAMMSPYITKQILDDGSISVSLNPQLGEFFSNSLTPETMHELETTALKVICFACPPCYEGNTHWSTSLKKTVWPILEATAHPDKVQEPLRTQAVQAILYFCERDSIQIRRAALQRSKMFLRKSMPYYLHASVVLFQSILHRLDGELARSEALIQEFLSKGPRPSTRRDFALQGRLHISQIENKIKCYDNDVSSFIYKWEAEQPLSTLDIEVTSRLQSAAARFFQSVGDFGAARASLEQFLSLNAANPIRTNTRRLIVGRLAEIYCEMKEHAKAGEIIQPEIDGTSISERPRRPYRRLLLALVEVNIGLGRLDKSESLLKELEDFLPLELADLYDQQLHVRGLFASARIAHLRPDPAEAILRWRYALHEIRKMYTLKLEGSFTEAMAYLSIAHAQMTIGDKDNSQLSWTTGLNILRKEKCEFWIPIVPTLWLQRIVSEVYELQGWSFRMMLPGGKPDITWP